MNPPATPFSRREFLTVGAVALAGVTVAGCAGDGMHASGHKKVPIGLELYSIREQCKTDMAGMLAAVSNIGYKGVEFAGYHGHSASELRKMLDANGLVCCGTHTPYDAVAPGKLAETIELNRTLGNKFVIVPWMEGKTKADWLAKAREFNELSDKLKPEGMFIGYHAHAHDFQKIDGESAWDLFFGNTRPEVIMQLDTGNCMDGGANPVDVLKRYPGRARSIHVKAHGGGPDAVVGEDKINWTEVFAWCEAQGHTQWYVLEHESGTDPLGAVKRSFEALRTMGKV